MDARHGHTIAGQLRQHARGKRGEIRSPCFGFGRRVAMTLHGLGRQHLAAGELGFECRQPFAQHVDLGGQGNDSTDGVVHGQRGEKVGLDIGDGALQCGIAFGHFSNT